VLLFWATWAAPSAEAMPDLRNYAAEFGKKGVRIVALNVGETPHQIDAFVKQIGYDGELGLDPRAETMAAFGLESTPSVVLIDRQGVVRGVWQGLEGDAKKKIFEATVAMLQAEAAAAGQGR
jgi:thiol-disulfide isomerase/thioredoxin